MRLVGILPAARGNAAAATERSKTLFPLILFVWTGWITGPVVLGYALDLAGIGLRTVWFTLALALGTVLSVAGFVKLFPGPYRVQRARIGSAVGLFLLTFALGLLIAWPSLLPVSHSVDAVHHYALIDYIFRHQRLVHGTDEAANLGEMVGYPFGACLIVAILAHALRLPPIYVMQPVVALVLAYTVVFGYAIVSELGADRVGCHVLAQTSLAAFLGPVSYTIGQFTRDFYLTQMFGIACLFGLWYWVVYYTRRPGYLPLVPMIGLGFALVVTYPTLLPPFAVSFLAAPVMANRSVPWRGHLGRVALVGAPLAVSAFLYLKDRIDLGMAIARHEGATISPGPDTLPLRFLLLAVVALAYVTYQRRTRPAAWFIWLTIAQTVLLYVAASHGAIANYTAKKMFFVLAPEMSVVIALGLTSTLMQVSRRSGLRAKRGLLQSAVALGFVLLVGQNWVREFQGIDPRTWTQPAVTPDILDCSMWAKANLGGQPILILTHDTMTAYWIDIGFLKHARSAFQPSSIPDPSPESLAHWLAGSFPQPYAFVVGKRSSETVPGLTTAYRCSGASILKRGGG